MSRLCSVVGGARRMIPNADRILGCPEPLDARMRDLVRPEVVEDCLVRAQVRWGTSDKHVLATLWWYNASHSLMSVVLGAVLSSQVMVVPQPEDAIRLRAEDGYPVGWGPSMLAEPEFGTGVLATRINALVSTLTEVTGRRPGPYWAVCGDAVAMAAHGASAMLPATCRRRIWKDAVDFHKLLRACAPIPELGFLPELITDPPGRQPDKPAVKPYRRVSCCLLYRSNSAKHCTDCPKNPSQRRASVQADR